jgi:hypothetical protein
MFFAGYPLCFSGGEGAILGKMGNCFSQYPLKVIYVHGNIFILENRKSISVKLYIKLSAFFAR